MRKVEAGTPPKVAFVIRGWRWYVGGEGGALEGPWSPGLYVVYQEGSGESRRVYVGP